MTWFCWKKSWFCIGVIAWGRFRHRFEVWPVDLQPLHVTRLWPCSKHALQWRRGCCPCLKALNIRPVVAVCSLLFRLVCARLSTSRSRRRCRLIGLRIGGGGGINSVLGGGRDRCQCGWKSEGVIAMVKLVNLPVKRGYYTHCFCVILSLIICQQGMPINLL